MSIDGSWFTDEEPDRCAPEVRAQPPFLRATPEVVVEAFERAGFADVTAIPVLDAHLIVAVAR